jgi:cytidylate kinase
MGSPPKPWVVLDRVILDRMLEERVLHEQYMSHVETRVVRGLDERITKLHRLHRPSTASVARTNRTILHLAAMGNVVIVGRGANVVTKDMPGGLHVRLVGSGSRRLKAIQNYYDLSPDAARGFMEGEDESRAAYVLRNFNKDVDDVLLYDLVVNTDGVEAATSARMLLEVLKVREGLAHPVPGLASAS